MIEAGEHIIVQKIDTERRYTKTYHELVDLYQPIVGYGVISLYNNLLRYVNNMIGHHNRGFSYPTLNKLAKKMKMAKKTLIKSRNLLSEMELLKIKREKKVIGNITCVKYYYVILDPIEPQEFYWRFGQEMIEKAGEEYFCEVFAEYIEDPLSGVSMETPREAPSGVSKETSAGVSMETVNKQSILNKKSSSSIHSADTKSCGYVDNSGKKYTDEQVNLLLQLYMDSQFVIPTADSGRQIESLLARWPYEYVRKQMEYTNERISYYALNYHPKEGKKIHSYWGYVVCACRDNYAKARVTYYEGV